MSKFYMKNKKGEFLPIEISSFINKDLNDHLVIVRVGTDDHPASKGDLDETEESFARADVLNDVDNMSLVVTPYQIDVGVVDIPKQDEKNIYIQIHSGEDIGMLEEQMKQNYRRLKKKFKNVVILPSPLKIKDYNQVLETLQRCQIRRKRRRTSQ